MSHTISRLLRGLLLATVLAVLAACASGRPPGPGSTSPVAAEGSAGSSSGTVLNLGDQQQNLETLLHASGALAGAPLQGQLH
jgi:hypothetical protein